MHLESRPEERTESVSLFSWAGHSTGKGRYIWRLTSHIALGPGTSRNDSLANQRKWAGGYGGMNSRRQSGNFSWTEQQVTKSSLWRIQDSLTFCSWKTKPSVQQYIHLGTWTSSRYLGFCILTRCCKHTHKGDNYSNSWFPGTWTKAK